MKKIFSLLTFLIVLNVFAQAPQGFNYQATVRNSSGALIINQNVYFKFNVIQGSSTSLPTFSETHYVPTDELGQVNLIIGQGTATIGSFTTIDWSLGTYYLGIELNTGSGYIAMGTTQLLSVPYALYAQNSGNSSASIPSLQQVLTENNSANNTKITNLAAPTENKDAANKVYVDNLVATTSIPAGNNMGDLLSWNGTSWQPIDNNSVFGGKATIYLTGDVTDAEAAAILAQKLGPNTEKIIVTNTTQLTTLNISGITELVSIEIKDNSALNSITVNDLLKIGDLTIFAGSYLSNVFTTFSFPSLQYVYNEIFIQAATAVSLPSLLKAHNKFEILYGIQNINLQNLQDVKELRITSGNLTNIALPSLVSFNSITLTNNKLTSSAVNNLLNKIVSINPTGKGIYLSEQTPPAPPTGQGITDKITLVNNGNSVGTD